MNEETFITIDRKGVISQLYNEHFDIRSLGTFTIKRASYVEPNALSGEWYADMGPSGGPVLGPYPNRTQALVAEADWLETFLSKGGLLCLTS